MTHDMKFDVPSLKKALATNAGYIGAIGSERTRTDRDQRLRDEGVGEADLARLHAPIGVQVGARTPEEVSVTIATQIIESNVVARAKRVATIARPTVLS
jgi:xanthine dehydrogenase accessory factor